MSAPLGLIAGTGDLPVRVAETATASGQGVYILRLKGFIEPRLAGYEGIEVGFGEIGKQLRALREAGCEEVCFAGNVSRPDFSSLKLDLRGARLLPKVLAAAREGDDALLRTILSVFEAEGFRIRGAEEIAGGLRAPAGLIAGPAPDAAALADIARAFEVAREIGRLDIGQGCVVCDGLVLAVEAQEGTDAMLARCALLPAHLKGNSATPRGVLAKCPKPQQDRKIDLPTLGMKTLEGVRAAGLAGATYQAGAALLMDLDAMRAYCEREGVFLYGAELE